MTFPTSGLRLAALVCFVDLLHWEAVRDLRLNMILVAVQGLDDD